MSHADRCNVGTSQVNSTSDTHYCRDEHPSVLCISERKECGEIQLETRVMVAPYGFRVQAVAVLRACVLSYLLFWLLLNQLRNEARYASLDSSGITVWLATGQAEAHASHG